MIPFLYVGRRLLTGLGLQKAVKPRFLFACSGVPISHPCNVGPAHCGDDAFFVVEDDHRSIIGIADGVGGWRRYDVDPSKFTRTLMMNCERLARSTTTETLNPVGLLQRAYEQMMRLKRPLAGSCTACIIVLDKDNKEVVAANLGDSGFMVVRGDNIVYQSQEQQHYFNTPYQLSISVDHRDVIQDKPSDAETIRISIEEGDIIVMATDGLFDNMYHTQIIDRLKAVDRQSPTYDSLKEAADKLASDARNLAEDEEYMSPFAMKAQNFGFNLRGGKLDDITIILAAVVNTLDYPDR